MLSLQSLQEVAASGRSVYCVRIHRAPCVLRLAAIGCLATLEAEAKVTKVLDSAYYSIARLFPESDEEEVNEGRGASQKGGGGEKLPRERASPKESSKEKRKKAEDPGEESGSKRGQREGGAKEGSRGNKE